MHEGVGFSAKPFEKSRFHLLTDRSGHPKCCVDLVNATFFVSSRNVPYQCVRLRLCSHYTQYLFNLLYSHSHV